MWSSTGGGIDDGGLPRDVVEEILLRLPVKEVLRCKSLSKTYYGLITNPRFIKRHLDLSSRSRSNVIALVRDRDSSSSSGNDNLVCLLPYLHSGVYFTPPTISNAANERGVYTFRIVGSCNGLVCAVIRPYFGCYPRTVFVWNPATREELILPPTPVLGHIVQESPKDAPPIPIVQESPKDALGFGYDPTSNDYILVTISPPYNRTIRVWSLRTNTWREMKNHSQFQKKPTDQLLDLYGDGVFVKGDLYWKARERGGLRQWILASFVILDDTFRSHIILPPEVVATADNTIRMGLTNHMGSPALYINDRDLHFSLWVMDETTNSWTKKYSIGPLLRTASFITTVNNGSMFLMRYWSLKDGKATIFGKFFLYDPHSKQEYSLSEDDDDHLSHEIAYSRTFCESLVSLKY